MSLAHFWTIYQGIIYQGIKGIICKTHERCSRQDCLDEPRILIQSYSIGKPRILDHNELIATPIEDNIDDDILVVENPLATPKPNVDIDVRVSARVALTCVQGNESIGE